MDRLKDWWFLIGIVGFIAGGVLVWWGKFTVYYLAEQSSVTTLTSLGTGAGEMLNHLSAIDKHLANIDTVTNSQDWLNRSNVTGDKAFSDQLDKLNRIAESNRDQLAQIHTDLATQHEQLGTQHEQLMFILDPKGKPPVVKSHE